MTSTPPNYFRGIALGYHLSEAHLPTAALASSPGGMSEVVSTANQGGADMVIVTFVHLVRLNSIVIVVPVIVVVFFGG